jgi:DNA-binding NtrC family response regulator
MPENVGEGRILIVEDEKVVADTLGKILSSNGYDIRIAYSAEAALMTISQWAPDVAIVDVILPKMNGVEFALGLKNRFANCHVLLFSGQPSAEGLMQEARNEGYEFEILAKPVHPTVMLDAISNLRSQCNPERCHRV